mmetsp:Transcript_125330/g.217289  ORF Transcript_125330/g.217289 Transcript_125330/m.217289 type:complete len:258 (+) Transcript_125330:128-901(+)
MQMLAGSRNTQGNGSRDPVCGYVFPAGTDLDRHCFHHNSPSDKPRSNHPMTSPPHPLRTCYRTTPITTANPLRPTSAPPQQKTGRTAIPQTYPQCPAHMDPGTRSSPCSWGEAITAKRVGAEIAYVRGTRARVRLGQWKVSNAAGDICSAQGTGLRDSGQNRAVRLVAGWGRGHWPGTSVGVHRWWPAPTPAWTMSKWDRNPRHSATATTTLGGDLPPALPCPMPGKVSRSDCPLMYFFFCVQACGQYALKGRPWCK